MKKKKNKKTMKLITQSCIMSLLVSNIYIFALFRFFFVSKKYILTFLLEMENIYILMLRRHLRKSLSLAPKFLKCT